MSAWSVGRASAARAETSALQQPPARCTRTQAARRRRAVGIFASVLFAVTLALAAGVTPSSAILLRLPGGGYAGYLPIKGAPVPSAAVRVSHPSLRGAANFGNDPFFNNLDYAGGPVMPANTNYLVVWDPASKVPSGFTTAISRYFKDLEADNGKSTNSDAVATQYNDVSGHTAAYNTKFAEELKDTDPYPASGCSEGSVCLTDGQIKEELQKFVSAHHLPEDLEHEYYLVTPEEVVSCNAPEACSPNANEHRVFCAYHSDAISGSGTIIYSDIPYTPVEGCNEIAGAGCPFLCFYPEGQEPSDYQLLSGLSHEHTESITDPLPNTSWTDFRNCPEGSSKFCGGEIGDKCAHDFFEFEHNETSLGFLEAEYWNQELNAHKYVLQFEWSNQSHTCRGELTPSASKVHASFTSSPAGPNAVNVDASSSTGPILYYVWESDREHLQVDIETTNPRTTLTYAAPGTYIVGLTVVAEDGTSNGTAAAVTVPPPSGGVGGGGGGVPQAAAPSPVPAIVVPPPSVKCVAPKLSGKSLTVARRILAAAHCAAGTVKKPRHAPRRRPPRHKKWKLVVVSQSASPGATVGPAGATINLVLAYRALK